VQPEHRDQVSLSLPLSLSDWCVFIPAGPIKDEYSLTHYSRTFLSEQGSRS